MIVASYQGFVLYVTWIVFTVAMLYTIVRGPQDQFDLFWPVRILVIFTAALLATVIALVAL